MIIHTHACTYMYIGENGLLFMCGHMIRHMILVLMHRVVVAVLDNFHFDLSLAQSVCSQEEKDKVSDNELLTSSQKGSGGGVPIKAASVKVEDGEDDVRLESEESQEELEMEEEESEEIVEEEEKKAGSTGEADRTKQRAMARKIHKAIVHSILPSLEAVLTKRVRTHIRIA